LLYLPDLPGAGPGNGQRTNDDNHPGSPVGRQAGIGTFKKR